MTKNAVVLVRDTLHGKSNQPVIARLDNEHFTIDESKTGQFILWDDDNEIVYVFSLPRANNDLYYSNKQKAIQVFATEYALIQSIERALVPLGNGETDADEIGLLGLIKNINKTGPTTTIPDDGAKKLWRMFNDLLTTDDPELLSRERKNLMFDGINLPTNEGYKQ